MPSPTLEHPAGSITREDHAVVIPAPAQPALTVTKTARDADGSAAGSLGETVNYTITAKNSGNVTLYGVTIADAIIPRLDCAPSVPVTLRPGDALVCTGTVSIRTADIDATFLANVATASGDDPAGRPVTGVGSALIDTVAAAVGVEKLNLSPSGSLGATVVSPPSLPATLDSTAPSVGGNALPATGIDIMRQFGLALLLLGSAFVTRRVSRLRRSMVRPSA